jgi:hypothetical protein
MLIEDLNIALLFLVTPDLDLLIQLRHSLTTVDCAFETPEGGEMGDYLTWIQR